MDYIIGFLVIAVLIVVIILLHYFNAVIITRKGIRNMEKKFEQGKINDRKLLALLKQAEKIKNGKVIAFLTYGIFSNMYLREQEKLYGVYRSEAERRGLV